MALRGVHTVARAEDASLLNRLKSIRHDAAFVDEVAQLHRRIPLIANLRAGLWYHRSFSGTARFKSTDGHCGHWDLSLRRLNLHLVDVLAQHGAVLLVDTTRRGRKLPDSFNRTIPIWAACLNRAVYRLREQARGEPEAAAQSSTTRESVGSPCTKRADGRESKPWDLELHTPCTVSDGEHAAITDGLDLLVNKLLASGVSDIHDFGLP